MDREDQLNYLTKVIVNTPYGYITYNQDPSEYNKINSFSALEIQSILSRENRKITVEEAYPATGSNTYLITWQPE